MLRKAYTVSNHLCCLRPLLGSGIIGGVSPLPNAKHDASSASPHPPSSFPEPRTHLTCDPPTAGILYLFVVYVAASPHLPMAGCCVLGGMASDIVDIIIASRPSCRHHHPHPCHLLIVGLLPEASPLPMGPSLSATSGKDNSVEAVEGSSCRPSYVHVVVGLVCSFDHKN